MMEVIVFIIIFLLCFVVISVALIIFAMINCIPKDNELWTQEDQYPNDWEDNK
jgi:hypothetical protein